VLRSKKARRRRASGGKFGAKRRGSTGIYSAAVGLGLDIEEAIEGVIVPFSSNNYENMEKGAQVWAVDRDGDDAWILCEVLSKTDTELKLQQIDKDSNVFARSRVDAKPAAGANDAVTETRYEGVELANANLACYSREVHVRKNLHLDWPSFDCRQSFPTATSLYECECDSATNDRELF
jgi:hypothetical protein